MAAWQLMKLPELDDVIVSAIADSNQEEITTVEYVATAERPDNHSRVKVTFASGRTATIMVRDVVGNGIPRHTPFDLPAAVV